MQELEKSIGYTFKNKEYLQRALTHSSYANEQKKVLESYERLEFLGDSILGFITARYLYENYPKTVEGDLTKARAALVCEKSLCKYAKSLELSPYISFGKGEVASDGKNRPSILADVFEAVLAAIYLDGGMEKAVEFVLKHIKKDAQGAIMGKTNKDYKTVLQEIVQRNKQETLEYKTAAEEGPAHDRLYVVELYLNSNLIGVGKGRSKKDAEQQSAKKALELMGEE